MVPSLISGLLTKALRLCSWWVDPILSVISGLLIKHIFGSADGESLISLMLLNPPDLPIIHSTGGEFLCAWQYF